MHAIAIGALATFVKIARKMKVKIQESMAGSGNFC